MLVISYISDLLVFKAQIIWDQQNQPQLVPFLDKEAISATDKLKKQWTSALQDKGLLTSHRDSKYFNLYDGRPSPFYAAITAGLVSNVNTLNLLWYQYQLCPFQYAKFTRKKSLVVQGRYWGDGFIDNNSAVMLTKPNEPLLPFIVSGDVSNAQQCNQFPSHIFRCRRQAIQ